MIVALVSKFDKIAKLIERLIVNINSKYQQ